MRHSSFCLWLAIVGMSAIVAGCGKQPDQGSQVQGPPPANSAPAGALPERESRLTMAPQAGSDVQPVAPDDSQRAPAAAPATTRATPPNVAVPTDSKVASFAGLSAPKPATWIWHPPSSASQSSGGIAQYAVPGRDGFDQAHITVFRAGGTLEANLTRWRGQFKSPEGQPVEPAIEDLEVDGMPVSLVEFAGQYKGAGATSFVPDQLFITAVVQAPAGQLFIRFVGPAGTVEPNRKPFMEMIRNLRKVEPEK